MENTNLEIAYYIVQIIVSILITIGLSILLYKETVKGNKIKIIENTVELARYYEENIIKNISFFQQLFNQAGLTDILIDKNKYSKYKEFDKDEFSNIFENDIDKMDEKVQAPIYRTTALNLYNLMFCPSDDMKVKIDNEKLADNKSAESQTVHLIVSNLAMETLNRMEHFAMNFNCNIAISQNVYESLSPSFITAVRLFYRQIVSKNIDTEPDNYYSNIIELYKKWSQNKEKTQKEINENIKDGKKRTKTPIEKCK